MTETGSSRKTVWWREVLIAFVVALVISTYYSAKLSQARRRAEQTEAQLKGASVTPESIAASPNNTVHAGPTFDVPSGTGHRVILHDGDILVARM